MSDALRDEPQRPLRRREYDQLVEAGAFEDERIELLEGRLVVMRPQKGPHALTVQLLTDLLVRALGDRAFVRVQLPLAISDLSEPEPDLVVVARVISSKHPTTAMLVVEVADASLRKDRDVKAALYAQAGIQEYWLVDLAGSAVTVHRDPAQGRYRDVRTAGRGEVVAMAAFPDVRCAIERILPPAGTPAPTRGAS